MRKALSINSLKSIYGRIAGYYDLEHRLLTAGSDQKGRKLLVEHSVKEGDKILYCGAGTGTAGLLAAEKVGEKGKVVLFDLSEEMLAVARNKITRAGLLDRVDFQAGDIVHLPFEDDSFDVVLSTYSLCPLYDPEKGALELYRVAKPGGKICVAHSAEPTNLVIKWLGDKVEDVAWKLPRVSMGCRSVSVLPALEAAGGKVIMLKHIGVPLWPFSVFIVEKPAA